MNCLIVDDDPIICDLVEHFCSKVPEIKNVTATNSGFEAVSLFENGNYDVVFLDYDLPDISGKEILDVIGSKAQVIMITSKAEFGAESYNYDSIVDFLVKPIEFGRFYKAIGKITQSNTTETNKHLFVKDGLKLVKIEFEKVDFFKSEANYTSVTLDGKKVLTLITMKELERKLPGFFLRVHRSYIVNLNQIKSIGKGECTLGKETIPVSSSYEKELLKKVSLLN